MKLLVVNNAEPADMHYNKRLVDAASQFAEVDVVEYRDSESRAEDAAAYDGVILSGVPLGYPFDTIDTRLPYLQWIKTTPLSILGTCLGHQNIGRLYGASLIQDEEAEEGPRQLIQTQASPLFDGIAGGQEIMASHRGSISVPDGFTLLAQTATCKNQVMKHATRDTYSVQFHPEFSDTGIRLIGNFVKIAAAKNCSNVLV